MSIDYYQILGVSKGASDDELKTAYRKKAMEHHPDKNKGDPDSEKRFKEVNEAYDVLKDPKKKAMYDAGAYDPSNSAGYNQSNSGGFGGFEGFGGFSGFEDIFEQMMGGGSRRRQEPEKGSDLLYNLSISLEDAYNGIEKEITINTYCKCSVCSGSGANGMPEYVACSACGGRGKVRKKAGFFSVEQVCNACYGVGRSIKNACKKCSATGREKRNRTLNVKIPAGIENGMRVRLTGEGEAGMNGVRAGDLYVSVNITPNYTFSRQHSDLFMQVSIPMSLASLGDTITIKTIDGSEIEVKIPAGVNSGQRIRIKDKGMKNLNNNSKGDLYIDILVETPAKLSKDQAEALKKLFPIDEKKKYSIKSQK